MSLIKSKGKGLINYIKQISEGNKYFPSRCPFSKSHIFAAFVLQWVAIKSYSTLKLPPNRSFSEAL